MGESCLLNRKVFNRIRQLREQNSNSSSTNQTSNSMDSKWSPMPSCSNSNSSPQLNMMARNGESDLDCSSLASELDGGELESAKFATGSRDNNQTETSVTSKRSSLSRLKIASRALLFFQRATNKSNLSSGPGDRHQVSSATNRKLGHRPTARSRESSEDLMEANQQQQQQQQVRTNGNEMNQVPQFIVPKLNALKLPLVCLIKSLDGELMREVFVHRYELGQYLIESLKVSVGINDCKYFGLKMAKSFDDQEDLKNVWLDLNESVCKQLKSKPNLINSNNNNNLSGPTSGNSNNNNGGNVCNPLQPNAPTIAHTTTTNQRSVDFYLRIKFYPPNLARVQDPFLRHYLWLQLRRDLRLGKLTSSMNNLTLLMACVLQYELGNFHANLVDRIPELTILPNQDLIEEQAIELWSRRLNGFKRHQAQMQFLRAAVILETYGFDYYPVRDHQRQRAYLLGFNYAGVKTIRNGCIVHHFSWHSLSKISYERRMIIFHIYPTENSKRKQILGFKCLSNEDCQSLYMRLLEQKYFFTVDLAYFDKSLPRRPTCLYSSQSQQDMQIEKTDWTPPRAQLRGQAEEPAPIDQPSSPENSRFTCCGPSLEANNDGDQFMLSGQTTTTTTSCDNSLESRNSASDSSQANCFTCEAPEFAMRAEPEDARDYITSGSSSSMQNFGPKTKPPDSNNENCPLPPPTSLNNSNSVSQRRTQWHRQRPAQRNFLANPQSLQRADDYCRPPIYSLELSGQEPEVCGYEAGGDQRTWAKVVNYVKSYRQNSNSNCGWASRRLTELAELLIQPLASILQCNNNDQYDSDDSGTLRRFHQASNETYLQVIMPTLRFCLVILVMNFVIRWTDSLSGSLIELLTLALPTSNEPM